MINWFDVHFNHEREESWLTGLMPTLITKERNKIYIDNPEIKQKTCNINGGTLGYNKNVSKTKSNPKMLK